MRHASPIRGALLALAAASLSQGAAAQAPQPGQWQFGASIYAFLPSIDGKTTFPTLPPGSGGSGGGLTVTADQLLDALKFTFMGAFEAHNGRWGVFTDLIYLDLGGSKSQTRDFSFGNVGIPAGTNANLNLDISGWQWSTAGLYRVASNPGFTMDVLAGARYFDLEQTLKYEFTGEIGPLPIPGRAGSVIAGVTVWDAIIGVKGRFAFGEGRKWSVPFYADVGAGESDQTWQAAAGLGYAFGWGEVSALWRHLDYGFKSGKKIQDISFDGPQIGATFRW